jgi:glycerophosphoryl diester phosphodiesterase
MNTTYSIGAAPAISRRGLIMGAAAAFVVAGCGAPPKPGARKPATITSLVADTPFYVAHRGGGDNWPEMTAYAYQQAALLPYVKAIEVSAVLSADRVLVCSHDLTTTRLTGVMYTIAKQTWRNLTELRVKPTWTSDPNQPSQPLARFDEVIEKYISSLVVFIEPKDPHAIKPMMEKAISLGNPERVVWKQPINQTNFRAAKEAGFATWAYVLNEPSHLGENLKRFAASPDIDFLGVPRYEDDEFIAEVVRAAETNGKKTIAWPIRTAENRSRVMQLGCSGMMTSNIVDLPKIPLS